MQQVFRPSGKLTLKYVLTVLLICMFCFLPWVLLAFAPGMGWAFAIVYLLANVIWVAIAVALIPLYCKTITYHLGEDELVVRRGLVTRAEDTVPYAMITNIGVRRGPLDRLLGLGGLAVHTAGYSAQNTGPEAKLVGLEDWQTVQTAIVEASRRRHGRGHAPVAELSATPAQAPAEGSALLSEILREVQGLRADLRNR
jgi:putative membrane protein